MNNIEKQSYNRFTLKFTRSKLENQYINLQYKKLENLYNAYLITNSTTNIISIIVSTMQQDMISLAFKISEIVLALLSYKIFSDKAIYKQYWLILFHFLEVIYLFEVSFPQIEEPFDSQYVAILSVITGIQLTYESFLALIMIHQWILQYIIWQVTLIYALFRASNILFIYFIAYSFIVGMSAGYFFYKLEKYFKDIFIRDLQYQKSERKWKKLINDSVPSAFISVDISESKEIIVNFTNKACISFFKLQGDNDIIKSFKLIRIQKSDLYEQFVASKAISNITQNTGIDLTLFDLLESDGIDIKSNKILLTLPNCTFQPTSQENIQYFDLIIFGSKWDNQQSIIINLNDISEKLRAQRMKELDVYKDQLLASVTHDLKTPLNGMISILQVTKQMIKQQKISNYIDIVLNNSFLLLSLIDDILDFSKIQQGQLKLICVQFSINEVMNELYELMSMQISEKKLKLNINIKNVLEPFYNDKNRLKQILINLISNALKFTTTGFINIYIEQIQTNLVQISVSDSGSGIPKDIIPQLFKLFATFDHNNGSNRQGTGLGLVICQKLAEQIGPKQKVQVHSEVGQGSKFSFLIYQHKHQEQTKSQGGNGGDVDNGGTGGCGSDGLEHLEHEQQNLLISMSMSQNNNNNQILVPIIELEKSNQQQNEIILNKQQLYNIGNTNQYMNKGKKEDEYVQDEADFNQIPNSDEYLNNQNIINEQIKSMNPKFMGFVASQESDLRQFFPTLTKILIVDDTPYNILGFKIILEQAKMVLIDEAFNGQQAIDKIKITIKKNEMMYKYIFMDLNMPVMDGLEAIKIIRKDFQQFNFKIISFTAYNDQTEKQKCLKAGADTVLVKPITRESCFRLFSSLVK